MSQPNPSRTFDLAWSHYHSGRWPQAEQLARQVMQADPTHAEALHLLGLIAAQTGRLDQAIELLGAAVRIRPELADAWNVLGIARIQRREPAEAAASFRRAVEAQPNLVTAHNNLGNVLRELSDLDAAAASFRQAVGIRPDLAEPHNNLGNTLLQLGRLEEAEISLRRALELRPDSPDIAFNLGLVLWNLDKVEEATACNRRVVQLNPSHADAHANLGSGLMECGDLDEAITEFRTSLRLKPGKQQVHSNLIRTLLYHPACGMEDIQAECRLWNERYAVPLRDEIRSHLNTSDPDRRLRIGYLNADYRSHADAFFLIPLLTNHDRERFEVFCYSDVRRPDALTARFRGLADSWRDVLGLSDARVAELVREDRIDILVDLKLHTADNRLLVFARRPAPVQVSWLGYPGTTGLSTIDYRLTDPYLDPPGLFDNQYSEESIRLPETFWCYDPLTDGPEVGDLPAVATGITTFGCLNSPAKVNDGCLVQWARLLENIPESRLLILAPRGRARERIAATLAREGVHASRVEYVDKRPREDYLRLYHRIDLALDPWPYNGHTTSLDAAWMGVPTITTIGRTVVGRAGWSQLSNLGLGDLAAATPGEAIDRAARLAADRSRLAELRRTLRDRIARSPLMDAPRFARGIEQVYREIWRRWCVGRPTNA